MTSETDKSIKPIAVRVSEWCEAHLTHVVLAAIAVFAIAGLLWNAEYYARVVLQSFQATASVFGGWLSIAGAVLTLVLGVALHYLGLVRWPALERIAGHPVNEMSVNAIYGIATLAVAALLMWVFAIVDAPPTVQASALQSKDGELTSVKKALNEASEVSKFYKSQIEQLTLENVALQKDEPVLTDAQMRIASVREQFLEHLSKAPTKETFTPELAHEWYIEASAMKEQTVSDDSTLFFMFFDKQVERNNTYDDFSDTLGGFRAIAINLTEKDLRNNTREPRD